jgi:hypothetical protein
MFLLEEHRPGAGPGLALALLRAWMAAGSKPSIGEEHDWLNKISPICLEMIEHELQKSAATQPCGQ